MLRAQLFRFARRMQGIGEQQQSIHKIRFSGAKHKGLAATIGVPSQKNFAGDLFTHRFHGALQAFAVSFGLRRVRQSKWAGLAKGKITAENGEA